MITPEQFELLLCEFAKKDLPLNFNVEHDIKDEGQESKNLRQIDTKITGKLGVADILICGEAKNWSKPVGSEFVDGLVGKYLSGEIRANKVIAFSNMGYTNPSIERCRKLGIELIEPAVLGEPIQEIPYIIGVGTIGQTLLTLTHNSQQQNLMALDQSQYVILKGDEKLSFNENLFRLVKAELGKITPKEITNDLSKLKIRDANVLYELKFKEYHKFNADFDMEVNIHWDYHCLKLPSGKLRHLNSNEEHFVHLSGDSMETLSKVLLSTEKTVYESKQQCIDEFIGTDEIHSFNMVLINTEKSKPGEPMLSLI